MPQVAIVIPTMRRPAMLAEAARSALAQTAPAGGFEVVIVDNDPEGSAIAIAAELKATSPVPVRYVHAPTPGVANARNAAVQATTAPFIAFLDDDEVAPEGWLAALLQAQANFDADAVFGPVRTRLPDAVQRHRAYFEAFFARSGPERAGEIDHAYGCGDSLVRRAALPDQTSPFAAFRNTIGGEDDYLFAQMKASGARFAWAPDAWVWEAPEPSRLTLDYTIRRAFAYGQGPSSAAFARGPRGWIAIPGWGLIGLAQMLTYGALAAVRILTGSQNIAEALDRAARGLGKILWFPPFKIGFYGQPALDRQNRKAKHAARETHARHRRLDPRAVG